jgi:ATP-dependent RNA helicase DDX18/HAS1
MSPDYEMEHLLILLQLEKLLQKNYYLHRSAQDGYRSYLQAYASYSLKKIFDVNKLDLVKVGKAFGFSVPPRVNITMGSAGGDSNAKHAKGKKRRRDEMEQEDAEMEDLEVTEENRPRGNGRGSKERRVEQLGHKKVEKEVYKIAKEKQRQYQKSSGSGQQWSR